MARTPRHVIQFRDALLAVRPREISIPGTRPGVVGVPGIREATRLQYNRDDFQSLGRRHEYSFALPNGHILELSVQFYLNNIGYWRLFAYSVVDGTKAHGMLFSVNITMGHDGSDIVQLKQRLALSTRGLTVDQRRGSTDEMAAQLRQSGLTIEDRNIVFTPFNTKSGKFDGGTASAFVRDFVVTAVLKGHYMANKGYSLPGIGPVAQPDPGSIAIGSIKAAEAAAVDSGAFDPHDATDARKKEVAAIVRRRGQPAFRQTLLRVYGGKCAVTGCDFEGTLEAAHISPYAGDHTDHVQNGLLLRADIHTLFDLHHLTIDSKTMKIRLAPALRGTAYQVLEGTAVFRPKDKALRPNPEALDMHRKAAGL